MGRNWLLGGALGAELALLASASWFGDFAVPWNARIFVGLMLAAGICFLAGMAILERSAAGETTGPGFWLEPRRVAGFWIVAVALRLAMLGTAPGDDMWRYLWEGRVQLAGHNPYVLSPSAPELTALRDANWQKINHPGSAAIYPPAAELALAGIARVSSDSLLWFKATFITADLLTLLLLVRMTGSYLQTAWYAWNPAVIYAFAGGGHYDSLMLLAMTASLYLLTRAASDAGQPPRWGPAWLSAACLGIAIALKLVPIFLAPVWLCALGRRSVVLVAAAAIPLLLSLPYGGPVTVLQPLRAFADVTRFHDLIWWLVEAITIPNPYGRNWPFTVALVIALVIATVRFRHDWKRCALWLLGLTLVLSPVLHPWYASWILPLACWQRAHAWTVLSLSALSAFLLWESTSLWTAWEPNLLTRLMVLLPPLAAWGLQSRLARRHSPQP